MFATAIAEASDFANEYSETKNRLPENLATLCEDGIWIYGFVTVACACIIPLPLRRIEISVTLVNDMVDNCD